MGSYSTLVRQCAVLVLIEGALVVLVALAASGQAALWTGIAGFVALAFFVAVSLWRRRQIMRLAAEVDEVLHEGRRVDFSNCREGDVAVLSNELSKMVMRLGRVSDQLADERNALADALADVSHQIRTPLTAINLLIPAIEHAETEAERRQGLRKLEHMLDRVTWLVTTLLKIARVDAGAMRFEEQPVKVADTVRRAVSPLEMAFDVRDIRLAVEVEDDAAFTGDARWTAEAIENIVKNCMEHTPAGGSVHVTAREDAVATTIVVTDSGPGIAADDLSRIFERFYRSDATGETTPCCIREEEAEGFGIGLSLAQALVSAQGGTIRATNAPEGGARFTITFPKLVV